MSNSAKKIIIILAVVLFIIAVGTGVYFGLQRSGRVLTPEDFFGPSDDAPSQQQVIRADQLPRLQKPTPEDIVSDEPESSLRLLTTDRVVGMWGYEEEGDAPSAILSHIFYITTDGTVKEVMPDGSIQERAQSNVGTPLWVEDFSSDGSAVVRFSDMRAMLFVPERNAWVVLPDAGTSFSFSANGSSLAYVTHTDNRTGVYTYQVSSGNQSLVLDIAAPALLVDWATASSLVLTPTPSGHVMATAWLVNISSRTITRLDEGLGLFYVWNGLGKGVRFVGGSNGSLETALVDLVANSEEPINLPTYANKCLYERDALVCGVPLNGIDSTALVPDDYLQGISVGLDSIIEYSSSGFIQHIARGELDVVTSSVVRVGEMIVFVNDLNDGLYGLTPDYSIMIPEPSETNY